MVPFHCHSGAAKVPATSSSPVAEMVRASSVQLPMARRFRLPGTVKGRAASGTR